MVIYITGVCPTCLRHRNQAVKWLCTELAGKCLKCKRLHLIEITEQAYAQKPNRCILFDVFLLLFFIPRPQCVSSHTPLSNCLLSRMLTDNSLLQSICTTRTFIQPIVLNEKKITVLPKIRWPDFLTVLHNHFYYLLLLWHCWWA